MALGGARPGAGRPKGSLNRATIENKASIEQLARAHSETAISTLVEIATQGNSESARVSAASAILDRGYGKPRQSIEGSVSVHDDGRPDSALDRRIEELQARIRAMSKSEGGEEQSPQLH